MKLDRNLLLAGLGVLALGAAGAFAQSANPGAATSSAPVALGPGSAIVGKTGIDQTTPGTTNKVFIGTDGQVAVPAVPAATTNASGTVTTGGSFQAALAASPTRKGCLIQNPVTATEPLYVYFGSGTPTATNSIGLNQGGVATCAIGNGSYVAPDAIQLMAATTGHPYVLNSQ